MDHAFEEYSRKLAAASFIVSILVLMDHAFEEYSRKLAAASFIVSILVLMDHAFEVSLITLTAKKP